MITRALCTYTLVWLQLGAAMARLSTPIARRRLSTVDHMRFKGSIDATDAAARNFTFIHIPKTGGESFLLDSPVHMPVGSSMKGNDECTFDGTDAAPNDMTVLLRHPVKHVLSQYLECKYDGDWGARVTENTGFPRGGADSTNVYDGFEEWVDHFLEKRAIPGGRDLAFGCYDPRDRQVRAFASQTGSTQCRHYVDDEADLHLSVDVAKENLKSVGFVGITDHYAATVCLFEYYAVGSFPDDGRCTCDGSTLQIGKHAHNAHNVPPHGIHELSDELLAKIHELVPGDMKLYHFALQLLRVALEDVEEVTGVDLLCGRDKQEIVDLAIHS